MKKHLLLPLVIGMIVLTGCSSNSENGATADTAGVPLPATAGGEGKQQSAPEAPAKEALGYGSTATSAPTAPVEGRSLIYRADIVVRVDDVRKAADTLSGMITTAGGFVAAEKRVDDPRQAQAQITVRIPSKEFASFMERIAGLGKEQHRSSNVEDVTEAIVDLDTRIAAQRASVESVRRMFERAATLQDVVLLEKELSQRQADLASLEAKKRRLDDLVALSTIAVTLAGPNTEITVEEEPDPTFLGGLKAGWKAFVSSVQTGSAILGFLLPFLAALAIPVLIVVGTVRYRRKRPEVTTSEATTS
ncbi:DUF4349 domain-containing protein [Allorhizocola rhizosphaerae]|uniref:DUF4349 domain-containing protein n=1 Tax=Allorhizocola rhizosphaerae TaxID=1872709 RepID=UPI0013C32AD0|nr:DUF4349 domain-containing protein [Allorhizocola rhizosphaerae]